MKKFLFISDFDGTITMQDFYHQILFRYEHEKVFTRYLAFKRGEISCLSFLSEVFADMGLTEDELIEEIKCIPVDPGFKRLVLKIQKLGFDVVILSAGNKYYIEKTLELLDLHNIRVISSNGVYDNGGIKTTQNKDDEFYSEDYGINKEEAFDHLSKMYEKVAYAGDGSLDFPACKKADYKFAKSTLESLLKREGMQYTQFSCFDEIADELLPKLDKLVANS